MISEFSKQTFRFARILPLLLLPGLVLSTNTFAADKYHVYTHFISLGELIAKPMLEVTEGETVGGTYSVKGAAEYKIVVLLRAAADNEVSVSLQFSSGNINIQPNVLVEIDKEFSATIDDKIVMKLLVQKVPDDVQTADS
jgi:hypothetical protein